MSSPTSQRVQGGALAAARDGSRHAFELTIPSCVVYFSNAKDTKNDKKFVTVSYFSSDVAELIRNKERLLFTKYPHTRICKLIKEKPNFATFIKLNFNKNYIILDQDRKPGFTYELTASTIIAAKVYAKEWYYNKQAGYILYVKEIIIISSPVVENTVNLNDNDDNYEDELIELSNNEKFDEYYLLEQQIINGNYDCVEDEPIPQEEPSKITRRHKKNNCVNNAILPSSTKLKLL